MKNRATSSMASSASSRTVRALIYAERFGPQRRVNGISLLLAHNFSQRFQGIRMVLPGSSPAAAWSWTAGRSASGRR